MDFKENRLEIYQIFNCDCRDIKGFPTFVRIKRCGMFYELLL